MIGGSVRNLHKLLVAVAENKTTLEEEAKQMIRDCVVKCTFEDLCQAADSGGADMDAQNNRSKMSRVLHIHSDAKFQTPNVKLIESEVVLNILCDQLAEKQRKALPDLIRASLHITPLGTLCGRLFQMHVAEVCKSKKVELVCTALKTNKDKTESAAVKICIPTLQKMLKKLGDQPPPKPLPEFDNLMRIACIVLNLRHFQPLIFSLLPMRARTSRFGYCRSRRQKVTTARLMLLTSSSTTISN